MLDKYKIGRIDYAIQTGNWSSLGDLTRSELLEYVKRKSEHGPVPCPLCGSTTKTNKFTFTARYVKFIMCFNWLSKQSLSKGQDGYVHYTEIQKMCQEKFGDSVTSYGNLSREPWHFLQPRINQDNKIARDGFFVPTTNVHMFLHKQLLIPTQIETLNGVVVEYSSDKVRIDEVESRTFSFKETIEIYKTF